MPRKPKQLTIAGLEALVGTREEAIARHRKAAPRSLAVQPEPDPQTRRGQPKPGASAPAKKSEAGGG
jgi:hypothetical protein